LTPGAYAGRLLRPLLPRLAQTSLPQDLVIRPVLMLTAVLDHLQQHRATTS
jgi:hypothetical protein